MAALIRFLFAGIIFAFGFLVHKLVTKNNKKSQQSVNEMAVQTDKRLIAARERFNSEIRELKAKEKAKAQKFRRIDWAWKFISLGAGMVVGGLMMEPMGGLAAIGLGILVSAFVGWLGAFINNFITKNKDEVGFVKVPARETINAPTVKTENLPQGRSELINQVLADAAVALNKIDASIKKLRHPESISSVAQIVTVGKRLMNHIANDPEKFSIAQRVFTYYCPEAVSVANALATLENEKKLDIERITSTQSVLQKLSILFERTEVEIKSDDAKALDIDLKLLNQSLESDLTKV